MTRAADALCRAGAPPPGSIRGEARGPRLAARPSTHSARPSAFRPPVREHGHMGPGRLRSYRHHVDRARRRCLDSLGAAHAHPVHPPGRPPPSKGWDRRPANQAPHALARAPRIRSTDLCQPDTSHADSAPRSFPECTALRRSTEPGSGSFSRRPARFGELPQSSAGISSGPRCGRARPPVPRHRMPCSSHAARRAEPPVEDRILGRTRERASLSAIR